jgi:hypothetical protein
LLRAGRSGDRILVGAKISPPVQTGPGAHPASYTMSTGSFSRGKAAEVKERVELYLYSLSGSLWTVIGWPLPFLHPVYWWVHERNKVENITWQRQGIQKYEEDSTGFKFVSHFLKNSSSKWRFAKMYCAYMKGQEPYLRFRLWVVDTVREETVIRRNFNILTSDVAALKLNTKWGKTLIHRTWNVHC